MTSALQLAWLRTVPIRWRGTDRPRPFDPLPFLPPELHPIAPIDDDVNGYAVMMRIVAHWPSEGAHAPDLRHRLRTLPGDRKAAEQALLPLRPLLERVPEALGVPRWQAIVSENANYEELQPIKRVVYGLMLRAELDGRPNDREMAREIAARLRRCEGTMMTFLAGVTLGNDVGGIDGGFEEDWRSAFRMDIARVGVHDLGRATLPDEKPPHRREPYAWEVRRLSQAWILRDHPRPFEPEETLRGLIEDYPKLLDRTAPPISTLWPPGILSLTPTMVSLPNLYRARRDLREDPNPYGLFARALIREFAFKTHEFVATPQRSGRA